MKLLVMLGSLHLQILTLKDLGRLNAHCSRKDLAVLRTARALYINITYMNRAMVPSAPQM